MIRLPQVIAAQGTPDFESVFKQSMAALGGVLPLQTGLTAGSYALEKPLEVMLIRSSETDDAIEVKAGIFYESLTPGCACAGDPTVESEQNEHITVLVTIDKYSAEATFQLLDE